MKSKVQVMIFGVLALFMLAAGYVFFGQVQAENVPVQADSVQVAQPMPEQADSLHMEAQKTPEPERAPHQGYTKKMLQQLLSIQKQDVPIDSSQCIAPKEFIRANHMRILNEWRNSSVREGNRVYVAHNGSKFEKSLNTCIGCHNNTFFCYYCHDYADVKPTCWNCHLSPLDSQK